MTAGHLKGALLEFMVRELMINCGFSSVKADGHYIFEQRGLFFINGKGAAHDADVLMEPPIQMPFSYPSRLLFECKSYERNVGLNVIRNGLGLRYDINEFEIVTDRTIDKRKNNKRAHYAISNRKRYYYQVGIASIEEFSKPAFEFAANNKIPLLSMRWFLKDSTCNLFRLINSAYLDLIPDSIPNLLYSYLKDKSTDVRDNRGYDEIREYLQTDTVIGRILNDFDEVINNCVIGLLETGDLLFLFSNQTSVDNLFRDQLQHKNLEARLHYYREDPTKWVLVINDYYRNNGSESYELRFNVPKSLLSQWREFNFDKVAGYNMKDEFFSRIFIFSQRAGGYGLPFTLVTLDSQWLDNLRSEENE